MHPQLCMPFYFARPWQRRLSDRPLEDFKNFMIFWILVQQAHKTIPRQIPSTRDNITSPSHDQLRYTSAPPEATDTQGDPEERKGPPFQDHVVVPVDKRREGCWKTSKSRVQRSALPRMCTARGSRSEGKARQAKRQKGRGSTDTSGPPHRPGVSQDASGEDSEERK